MWSYSFTIFVLIFATFETNANFGNNDEHANIPASKQKVDNISNKIDKIARDILSRSSLNNRGYVIKNVEEKLLKAAEHLGEKGKSHVKLIMEGIKLKVFNTKKDATVVQEESKLKNNFSSSLINNDDTNDQIIRDLSEKIELLIKSELRKIIIPNSQNPLDNIKRRVLESVHEKLNEILGLGKSFNVENETRRMPLSKIDYDMNFKNHLTDNAESYKDNKEPGSTFKRFTVTPVCDNVYERACSDIKRMNSLKCLYDDVFVSLEKLCDGNDDCPDKSDEKYCGSQAMERMQFSNEVINNIETYLQNNCFATEDAQSVFSKQTFVLRDVLQSQFEFKEKYRNFSIHMNNVADKKDSDSEGNVKRRANEIAIIISSLALALDSALCSHRSEDVLIYRRANIFDADLNKLLKDIIWPPKCSCRKEHCLNCSDACKRICWHKYSLTKWKCESINSSSAVSLDSLCDGKLDCFDESDERSCDIDTGYAKIESREMYSNIIKMLNMKSSKEVPSAQNKLNSLSNMIQKLQKLTAKPIPNVEAIKKLRNKCYSRIKDIYTDILKHSSATDSTEEAYTFLSAINQKLGVALKRSHTGNKRIIPDGCFCRNGTCAVHFCSKVCIKACSVEPKLMRYDCKRRSNVTVSIDKVCNGKDDCPGGYDELDCNKEEICRRHHLLMLRNNLEEVGNHLKGTALGELLISWKTKVISTIKVAVRDSRPKPRVMKNIVKDILRDLLVTYGSLESYRRSNTAYALPEFMIISQLIIETLKSCGK